MIKQNKSLQPTSWKYMCEQLDKTLGITARPNRWLSPATENKDRNIVGFSVEQLITDDALRTELINTMIHNSSNRASRRDK